MARKKIRIGKEEEQMLKDFIAGDNPSIHPQKVLSGEIKTEADSVTTYSLAAGGNNATETSEKNEEAKAQAGKQAAVHHRTSPRRKKSPKEFEDLFLVKRVNTGKRQTYVSEEIYFKIRKYLTVIDCQFSITAYIDNILLHHIEEYKDVIQELYDESVKKQI